MTRLPSERQSDSSTPRRERDSNGHYRQRDGYRDPLQRAQISSQRPPPGVTPSDLPATGETQMKSVLSALRLAVSAKQTVVEVSDACWAGDPQWKQNYNKVDDTNREELNHRLGDENRRKRAQNKALGLSR